MTDEEIKFLNNKLDAIDRHDAKQSNVALQQERQRIIDRLMAEQTTGTDRQKAANQTG